MHPNPDIIRQMVRAGRAADLHAMLLSISPYSKPESKPEVPCRSQDEASLVTLVIHHLEFVSQHGPNVAEAWNGKFTQRSHPAEFERWLSVGMPHLCWSDVDAYLRDHPLAGD